ncbi:hypothetical protein [Desulfomonile tiedjei]|uniref:Uncharacterized protein n=1 Tax=Desulfomonile tiedjei (strain ATCC 49306 / DSM 6799 / DCB-1) TaxID=706587 RepID=I4C4V2_DESTA|nr:hypothetical protein [Desulfomonile tiedjei]AFM24593.1 hypothetical protein Desti_1885 [Desulfomonile tiedjei DSM 6799]
MTNLYYHHIDAAILGKLLALYFPNYPPCKEDLDALVSELNDQNCRLTHIVDACQRILPLLSIPGSAVEVEFKKLAAEGRLNQNDALRLVLELQKKFDSV